MVINNDGGEDVSTRTVRWTRDCVVGPDGGTTLRNERGKGETEEWGPTNPHRDERDEPEVMD